MTSWCFISKSFWLPSYALVVDRDASINDYWYPVFTGDASPYDEYDVDKQSNLDIRDPPPGTTSWNLNLNRDVRFNPTF